MKVIIDGVEYVPVMKSNPDAEKIARGVMDSFWGACPNMTVEEMAEDLRVIVTDSASKNEGVTVEEAVKSILENMGRGEKA